MWFLIGGIRVNSKVPNDKKKRISIEPMHSLVTVKESFKEG